MIIQIGKDTGVFRIDTNAFDEELVTFKFKHPNLRITSMLYTGACNKNGERIYVIDTEEKDSTYII